MSSKCIYIFAYFVLVICLFNLYKINKKTERIGTNEYYDNKSDKLQNKKLKSTNLNYGKIVSVDNDGNLGSFEFPKGIIVAWSGDISNIPNGWTICNGTNGAPDLRGRFILGANPNSNKNTDMMVNEMNSKGGKERALLKHKHQYYQIVSDGDDWKGGYEVTYPNGGNKTYVLVSDRGESDGSANNQDHRNISDTSELGDENTMPPYYTLAYIMKL
jgi:hypothetical protein